MRTYLVTSLFVLLVFLVSGQSLIPVVFAADGLNPGILPAPNWDRRLAMEVAFTADIQQETDRLLNLVTGDDVAASVQSLNRLATRPDWSQPARDAAIYEFMNRLRSLPPFSVDPEILDFLHNYQPQVRIAHQESFTTGVPLFPIRAAAAGLVNQWTRQQAEIDAAELLRRDPEELLSIYAANPDINIRSGIEAAVSDAPGQSLLALLDHGVPLLPGYPELTGLLGKTAIASGDPQSVSDVFNYGSGHQLVELSRLAGRRFSAVELGEILLSAIKSAPPVNAAIAIAGMTPYSIQQQAVGAAVLNKLDDPTLGSTAALALASWGSDQQRAALKARADSAPSSLAAKRAQTALSLESTSTRRGLQR